MKLCMYSHIQRYCIACFSGRKRLHVYDNWLIPADFSVKSSFIWPPVNVSSVTFELLYVLYYLITSLSLTIFEPKC